MVSVTVVTPEAALDVPWAALSGRAGNAFMNPVALRAAEATLGGAIRVLLAWEDDAEPARLVGLWAFREKPLLPPGPRVLEALPYAYAFISTPAVEPSHAEAVVSAFFAAIARDPTLPKLLWLKDLDAEGPVFSAIEQTVAAQGLAEVGLRRRLAPVATRETGIKTSGSTRKKLRQDWNRLSRLGAVEIANARNAAETAAAMEVFLRLEMAGWKGREGTALLCRAGDAAFARRFIGDLAATGAASVALLSVGGKPVAAQVLLYCGRTAYTWKPAFDEAHARFSPGSLLVDRITAELLAGDVDLIDSCAVEESFMGGLWSGRKPMIDLLLDVRRGGSPAFMIASAYRRGHETLRVLRGRVRATLAGPGRGKRHPAGGGGGPG